MNARKVGAIGCLVALTSPLTFATAGAKEDPARVVREAVVSTVASDGSVLETTVSQLIHLDAKRGPVEIRVPKVAELDSYRNLSGFRNPSGEGNDLVWRTTGQLNATALARFSGELPIDVDVRYFLDGREIAADELKRRSGDVKIEVEISNVSSEAKMLEYKAATSPFLTSVVNQYVPFQYQVRAEFPIDRWSDVGGDGVHVTNDAGKEVASASGILSPPLTASSQTITIEGRSDDVLTPRIQVFAFPGIAQSFLDSMQEQFEALQALYGGVGGIQENLKAIYEGSLEIEKGVEDLLGGVGRIDEDSKDPVVKLDDDGKPTTLLGAIGYISEQISKTVLPSLGERDPQSGKGIVKKNEKGNLDPETLIASLQSQKDAFDEDLIPGMDDLIGGVEGLIGGLRSGDLSEPGVTEGLTLIAGGLEQLKDGLRSGSAADPGAIEALTLVSQGLTALFNSIDEHPAVEDDNPATPPGTPTDFIEALQAIEGLATAGISLGNPTGLFDDILAIVAGVDLPDPMEDIPGLLDKLGSRDATTGAPNLVFDSPACAPACASDAITALAVMMGILNGNAALGIVPGVIEGLGDAVDGIEAMQGGLDDVLAGIGAIDPETGEPVIDFDSEGNPTTLLGALGYIKNVALENPKWTQAQGAFGGKTPKEYYTGCPACFDPDSSVFDAGTVGLGPGFRDVFVLFSEGIARALPRLHSFDLKTPGLVDGLQQIADGLDELADGLHTFDADDPGLVDGLELLRSGVQQVGQGLFLVDELGLRTVRGQVGDTADQIARDRATLEDKARAIRDDSVLASDVDLASATYVFELPAQQTAARDNLVRAALLAVVLAGISVLARSMRRLDLT